MRGEHGRLLSVWREVVTFRRHFLKMKSATDRSVWGLEERFASADSELKAAGSVREGWGQCLGGRVAVTG